MYIFLWREVVFTVARQLFKILLIGDSGVGKSSQLRRFTDNTFTNTYCSTIGVDFAIRVLSFGERTVKLQVWDTSGQERFRSITSSYYRGAHAVMIVYASNSRNSFDALPGWLKEVSDAATMHLLNTLARALSALSHTPCHSQVDRYCADSAVKMIVAAKNDLEHAVSDAEGRAFATRHGCLFASTSAKTSDGVFDSFAALARAAGQLDDSDVRSGVDRVVARQADTNVMRVDLAKLADSNVALITGDPTRCRGCGVFMSALSTDVQQQQHQQQQRMLTACPIEMAPPIHPLFAFADERANVAPAPSVWCCEFCGCANAVHTSDAELAELRHAGSVMDFLVRPAPTVEAKPQHQQQAGDGKTILFVLDVSGSMCCTSEVPNARAHAFKGRSGCEEEFTGLLRQDEARHQQFLPRQARNVAYVSRLALVQAAVAKQINELWQREPDVRVGLIAFSDAVHLIGDAMGPATIVAGDRLHSWDQLNAVEFSVRHSLAASKNALLEKLWALREGGQTALGPALHLAINASSANGTIVLGTDGLANVGLGDLSSASHLVDANQFYVELGERCRVKGVTANIISIEGAECRLQSLETVVQQSRGTLHRIDPLALGDVMGALVDQPTVAQTVLAMTCLHRGLHFKGEADDELERRNWLVRDCGTVHPGDAITLSFGFRAKNEFDFTNSKSVPLQLQLLHTRSDGSQYVRVCSVTLALTADKGAMDATLDASVLNTHTAQRLAKILQRGEHLEAMQTLDDARRVLGSELHAQLVELNDNNATLSSDALIAKTSKFCTKM